MPMPTNEFSGLLIKSARVGELGESLPNKGRVPPLPEGGGELQYFGLPVLPYYELSVCQY